MNFPADNFCIWPQAPPRCQCGALLGRKPNDADPLDSHQPRLAEREITARSAEPVPKSFRAIRAIERIHHDRQAGCCQPFRARRGRPVRRGKR